MTRRRIPGIRRTPRAAPRAAAARPICARPAATACSTASPQTRALKRRAPLVLLRGAGDEAISACEIDGRKLLRSRAMISNQKTLSPICRRELLALVGAAVAFRPFTAVAQPGKVPTIGALVVGSPGAEQFWKLFRDAMQQLG